MPSGVYKRTKKARENIGKAALTSKLLDAIKNDKPDDFKKMIMDYLMKQQGLNTEFSIDLLKAIPKEVDKDRFDSIVKPLEKELNDEYN